MVKKFNYRYSGKTPQMQIWKRKRGQNQHGEFTRPGWVNREDIADCSPAKIKGTASAVPFILTPG
jgi:hypothetical protein